MSRWGTFSLVHSKVPAPAAAQSRNPLIFVFLTVLIDTIGFGIIMPVLPRLIMEIAGLDLSGAARMGGLLLVVFAALQFLFGPVIGNLSDRYGRRPVLLLSLFAFGVNYALMGLAPSLAWLFAGRAVTGICGAIFGPANAFVADVTPPEKRAQSFGMIGAAFGLGFVLGPALGGFLGELGPRAPFFAAAGLALLNFGYGLAVLPETLPKERRRPFSLARANPLGTLLALRSHRRVLVLVTTAFVWQLAFHVYPATWAYFVIAKFGFSPAAIGGTLALSGLSMALVQGFLTGRIVGALGETRAAPIGVAVGMCAFLSYAFMNESWMLYPTLAVGGLQGIAMPAMNSLMSKLLGPERQGELQGGIASMMGLSAIVGPLVLTDAMARYSGPSAEVQFPGAAFLVAAGMAALCLVMLLGQVGAKGEN
jgi:DHA1 family tetracycline resistance protein-like MFS transporter